MKSIIISIILKKLDSKLLVYILTKLMFGKLKSKNFANHLKSLLQYQFFLFIKLNKFYV